MIARVSQVVERWAHLFLRRERRARVLGLVEAQIDSLIGPQSATVAQNMISECHLTGVFWISQMCIPTQAGCNRHMMGVSSNIWLYVDGKHRTP